MTIRFHVLLKTICVFLYFSLLSGLPAVLAQGPPPPPSCPTPPCVTVPLDGGISVLLAAGMAYGVNTIYKRKKQDRNQD